jgi:hypothetical protein
MRAPRGLWNPEVINRLLPMIYGLRRPHLVSRQKRKSLDLSDPWIQGVGESRL